MDCLASFAECSNREVVWCSGVCSQREAKRPRRQAAPLQPQKPATTLHRPRPVNTLKVSATIPAQPPIESGEHCAQIIAHLVPVTLTSNVCVSKLFASLADLLLRLSASLNEPLCPAATSTQEQDPTAPNAAETARTVLDLSDSGTLCTTQQDGMPLGTYTSYVLDQQGQPILRLRADAVHTANLARDPRCSLFVQPCAHPARLLARATLMGVAEPADEVQPCMITIIHAPAFLCNLINGMSKWIL